MYPLLFNLGMTEIIVIVLIIVLFFGGRKIPELMRGMGHGVREFKDALEKPAADKSADGPSATTDQKKPARTQKTHRNVSAAKARPHKNGPSTKTETPIRKKNASAAAKANTGTTTKENAVTNTPKKSSGKPTTKSTTRKNASKPVSPTADETAEKQTVKKTAKRPVRRPAKKAEATRTDE